MGLQRAASPTPIQTLPLSPEAADADDFEWLDAPLDSISEKLKLPLNSGAADGWCRYCQSPPPGARSTTPGDYGSTRSPTQGGWTPSPSTCATIRSPSPQFRSGSKSSRSQTPTEPRMLLELEAMRSIGPSRSSQHSESTNNEDVEGRPQPAFRLNRYRRGAWNARRVGSPPAPPGCKQHQTSKPPIDKSLFPTVDELFTSLPPEERMSVEARGPVKVRDIYRREDGQPGLDMSDSIDATLDLIDERLGTPGFLSVTQQSMLDSIRFSVPEEGTKSSRRGAALPNKKGRLKPKPPIDKTQSTFTSIFDSKDSVLCRGCGAYGARRVGAPPPPPPSAPKSTPSQCASPYLRKVATESRSKSVDPDDEPFKDADIHELMLLESFAGKAVLRGYGAEAEQMRRVLQKADDNADRQSRLNEVKAQLTSWRQHHDALLQRKKALAETKTKQVKVRVSRKHSSLKSSAWSSTFRGWEKRRSTISTIGDDSEEESEEEDNDEDSQPLKRQSWQRGWRMTPSSINLSGLKSTQTAEKRMKNLKKLQKERNKEKYNAKRRDCVTKVEHDDLANLMASFNKYDKKDEGTLKYADIVQLLYDAGLRSTNAAERAGVQRVFRTIAAEMDPPIHPESLRMDFRELLQCIAKVRRKLQDSREPVVAELFSKYDVNDRGKVTLDQVDDVLHELHIYPNTDEGLKRLYALKLDADAGQQRLIPYLEFSKLVEHMREAHHKYQAGEQAKIAEELGIYEDRELFFQVRDDLEALRYQFKLFDADGNNVLDQEEVWAMLGALGLVPKTYGEKQWMANVMSEYSTSSHTFSFPRFVKLMTAIRMQQKIDMRDYLKQVFKKYDRNGDGELSVSEISKALEDLDMCPRSSAEQKVIKEFLETVGENPDGDGGKPLIALSFDAFQEFMQHVRERMQQTEREAESLLAQSLNFDALTVSNFRIAFSTLDVKGTGHIPFIGVRQVLGILKYRVPTEKLKQMYFSKTKGSVSGEMNFMQFLEMVKEFDSYLVVPEPKPQEISDPEQQWLRRYTTM
eukprot:gnl/MRDRNA2_/MRDRNA2_105705_c0_seq1.p1 gnl/MRDRNA2_/MRDRNA2_105705_c0~~gnl/MRDRNA2_/MRDRNA2_105705_c0_seq1.p1  ORF type:complete len:1029 (+),score=218.65 gnl/MRDRNA2_/MRDRNA2_105705_c0_seq1:119-3205(+)